MLSLQYHLEVLYVECMKLCYMEGIINSFCFWIFNFAHHFERPSTCISAAKLHCGLGEMSRELLMFSWSEFFIYSDKGIP